METNQNHQEQMSVAQPHHIGKMLAVYFDGLSKTQAQLARRLKMANSSLSRMLDRDSLNFTVLWNICLTMNHNFIAELGEKLPVEFVSTREKELQEQLSAKQMEIDKLNMELLLYKNFVVK